MTWISVCLLQAPWASYWLIQRARISTQHLLSMMLMLTASLNSHHSPPLAPSSDHLLCSSELALCSHCLVWSGIKWSLCRRDSDKYTCPGKDGSRPTEKSRNSSNRSPRNRPLKDRFESITLKWLRGHFKEWPHVPSEHMYNYPKRNQADLPLV